MSDLLALSARIIDADVYDRELSRTNQSLSEVGDRVALIESFSNVVLFGTDAGLVLFDTSLPMTVGECLKSMRGWSADAVHSIVYTHGHVDHVGGAGALFQEAAGRGDATPRVVGHENVRHRFDRYALTSGYNNAINERQFGFKAAPGRAFLDPSTPSVDTAFRDSLRLNVGGLDFELRHARGETDDHLWGWIPEHKALVTGDFVLPAFPNAGNPQKQQRYPLEWAQALRDMDAMGAELLLPAHGLPIGGRERIHSVLDRIASALEHLVSESLKLMNEGAPLDAILHSVKIPDGQLSRPYLAPIYDEPEFILHNIWRLYGGWYDGDPAHLKPAPASKLALEFSRLAGGVSSLVERAQQLSASGDMRLACHLIETAVQAEPENVEAHAARAEIYETRRKQESSLMSKGVFGHAARQSTSKLP